MTKAALQKAGAAALLVLRILLAAAVALLLVDNVYMLVARLAFKQEMPTFLGFSSAAVRTGSMEPTIAAGDYIVTLSRGEYEEGDVVMFRDPYGGYTTHRIVGGSAEGFLTAGDANNGSVDPWRVGQEDIVGEAALARYRALTAQKEAAESQYAEANQRTVGAEANILRCEADLDMARLNLSYTVLTAPYDGYIGRRTLEPGQFVQAGQTISLRKESSHMRIFIDCVS